MFKPDGNRLTGSSDLKEVQLESLDAIRSMGKNMLSILHFIKNDKEKLELLRGMENALGECAIAEHRILESERTSAEAYREVSQQMQEGIDIGSEVASVEHFTMMYESLFEEKQSLLNDDDVVSNDTEVQVIRHEIEACIENSNIDGKKVITFENEDLVATEEPINTIDPIGKKVMTDPVRNKICKHVYERSTVLQLIKQSRRKGFKCPTMGCSNRKNISESDLIEAPDVLRVIRLQESECT